MLDVEERPDVAAADSEESGEENAEKPTEWTDCKLREADEGWDRCRGFIKVHIQALLADRLLFFEGKPYIDRLQHSVKRYAEYFLTQPAEMGWSLDMEPDFFCELAYEGFNPISMEVPTDDGVVAQILTPCFELQRNVITCLQTHVGKKVRRRARNYSLTVDEAYDDVMRGCIECHGEAWLHRGLRWLLRKLRKEGYQGDKSINLKLRSFELWDKHGKLVAGDLGYTIGALYISQSGFHCEGSVGAGEVQLVLMSALLYKMGHTWFDLGQARDYKAALGAETLGRESWLKRFLSVRDGQCRCAHERVEGQALLDFLLTNQRKHDKHR